LTSPPSSHDAIAALNDVLSEVVDLVQDVKQAHRKVPENHALHAELDRLSEDLRSWAARLMDQDKALGASPLSHITSVAGRTPPNLWPGDATDDEVRLTVVEHLERLAEHASVARAEQDVGQDAGGPGGVLAGIQQELSLHIRDLNEMNP
jgi:DNA-binding ferritin-like protein